MRSASPGNLRGRVFSIYMIVNLSAVATGQILLVVAAPKDFILFALVSILFALSLPGTVAGSVFVETIFGWPGMGKLIIESINLLDRPVIVAYLMVTVIIIAVTALGVNLSDMFQAIADAIANVTP